MRGNLINQKRNFKPLLRFSTNIYLDGFEGEFFGKKIKMILAALFYVIFYVMYRKNRTIASFKSEDEKILNRVSLLVKVFVFIAFIFRKGTTILKFNRLLINRVLAYVKVLESEPFSFRDFRVLKDSSSV